MTEMITEQEMTTKRNRRLGRWRNWWSVGALFWFYTVRWNTDGFSFVCVFCLRLLGLSEIVLVVMATDQLSPLWRT